MPNPLSIEWPTPTRVLINILQVGRKDFNSIVEDYPAGLFRKWSFSPVRFFHTWYSREEHKDASYAMIKGIWIFGIRIVTIYSFNIPTKIIPGCIVEIPEDALQCLVIDISGNNYTGRLLTGGGNLSQESTGFYAHEARLISMRTRKR
jgi:hypothetical protein